MTKLQALALLLSLPHVGWAHGSEYVYARLILEDKPRLELSLEYNDNPIVDSREQAQSILEKDLILQDDRLKSDLAGLARHVKWSEGALFPASAPVPVPDPSEGIDHRLVTVSLDLSGRFQGPFRLAVKPGSEQAVVYWIDERRPDDQPPRWQILIAGDTSDEVVLPSLAQVIPLPVGFVLSAALVLFVIARRRRI